MHRLRTLFTVIGAATVLVLAGNTVAMAATGHGFILGQTNKANKVTVLKRTTAGSALQLRTTSSSAAPLIVNGGGKVANLNSDKLDGYDSTALRTSAYSWTRSVGSATANTTMDIPLGAGTYVIGYDAYMTNGGLTGDVAGCYLWRQRGSDYVYYAETRYATLTGSSVGASGTTILSVAAGDDVKLYCYAPTNWTTDSAQPIHVYAIRTAFAGGGALRTAPGGARVTH